MVDLTKPTPSASESAQDVLKSLRRSASTFVHDIERALNALSLDLEEAENRGQASVGDLKAEIATLTFELDRARKSEAEGRQAALEGRLERDSAMEKVRAMEKERDSAVERARAMEEARDSERQRTQDLEARLISAKREALDELHQEDAFKTAAGKYTWPYFLSGVKRGYTDCLENIRATHPGISIDEAKLTMPQSPEDLPDVIAPDEETDGDV